MEEYGYTQGCAKCERILNGDTSQPSLGHSNECRARIIKEMSKDPMIKKKVEEHEERKAKYAQGKAESERANQKPSSEKTNEGDTPVIPETKTPNACGEKTEEHGVDPPPAGTLKAGLRQEPDETQLPQSEPKGSELAKKMHPS